MEGAAGDDPGATAGVGGKSLKVDGTGSVLP